jgi:hypothetical protein
MIYWKANRVKRKGKGGVGDFEWKRKELGDR